MIKSKPDPDKTIWTASEACYELGVTYKTLALWVDNAGLPAKNVGTKKKAHYLFLKSDVERWIRQEDEATARALAGLRR